MVAAGVEWTLISGDFQGHAYVLSNGIGSVIAVEHETGLEILYISGSIASLVGVVPLVLQRWRWLRDHRHGWRDGLERPLELRKIDKQGNLTEEDVHESRQGPLTSVAFLQRALAAAANSAEANIAALSHKLDSILARIEALEQATRKKL